MNEDMLIAWLVIQAMLITGAAALVWLVWDGYKARRNRVGLDKYTPGAFMRSEHNQWWK